jgi:molybdate transport system substrate-binding protein
MMAGQLYTRKTMMNLRRTALIITCFVAINTSVKGQEHRFDPPWNTPPQSKVMFTVAGIDNVPDLFGDINDPQLVIFFAGNQFMVVDDLLAAFKQKYPQYQRIFAETLPPGILARQIAGGDITIGNMRITLKPDIYTDGKNSMDKLQQLFSKTEPYANNNLAIMVQKGNPKNIQGLTDLGKPGIRVSMPNPEFESIGKRIEEAYVKAGGEALRKNIMEEKVKDSSTYLTQIHHRQTPMRIMYNQADAAPVWYSEAYYQIMIKHPVSMVKIPESQNIRAIYTAGQLKNAPHLQAATDFMDFLLSPVAQAIYKKYGFNNK